MIDTNLRKHVQPIFNTISQACIKLKLTPMMLTLAAFVVGSSGGLLVAMDHYYLAVFALIGSGLLDVLDGSVARLTHQASKRGAFMDLVLDRMVEASVILGLYASRPQYAWAYLLFLVAVIFNFSTFMVAGALWQNEGKKSMHYDVGIVERTETFVAFVLVLLVPQILMYVMMVLNSLIFLTGIIRSYRIMKDEHYE